MTGNRFRFPIGLLVSSIVLSMALMNALVSCSPMTNSKMLDRSDMSKAEIAIWDRLASARKIPSYKPYNVYEDINDLLHFHRKGQDFVYQELDSSLLSALNQAKRASIKNCDAETYRAKWNLLKESRYQSYPNVINYLKHYLDEQALTCSKAGQLELKTEVSSIPVKRRKLLNKLRKLIVAFHVKLNPLEELDVESNGFIRALGKFMVNHQLTKDPSSEPYDESKFTKRFMKLMYEPCRDIGDASGPFLDYYESLIVEPDQRNRMTKSLSRETRKSLALANTCKAIMKLDQETTPGFADLFSAYISEFELIQGPKKSPETEAQEPEDHEPEDDDDEEKDGEHEEAEEEEDDDDEHEDEEEEEEAVEKAPQVSAPEVVKSVGEQAQALPETEDAEDEQEAADEEDEDEEEEEEEEDEPEEDDEHESQSNAVPHPFVLPSNPGHPFDGHPDEDDDSIDEPSDIEDEDEEEQEEEEPEEEEANEEPEQHADGHPGEQDQADEDDEREDEDEPEQEDEDMDDNDDVEVAAHKPPTAMDSPKPPMPEFKPLITQPLIPSHPAMTPFMRNNKMFSKLNNIRSQSNS